MHYYLLTTFVTLALAGCELSVTELKMPFFYPQDSAAVALSSDGRYFYQFTRGGGLIVWFVPSQSFINLFSRNQTIGQMYVDLQSMPATHGANPEYIAVGTTWSLPNYDVRGTVFLTDPFGMSIYNISVTVGPLSRGWTARYRLSNTNRYLAVGDYSANGQSTLILYEISTRRMIRWAVDPSTITQIAFAADDSVLMTKTSNRVKFWTPQGNLVRTVTLPNDYVDVEATPINGLQLTSDQRYLVVHSDNKLSFLIWDLQQNLVVYQGTWVANGARSSVISVQGTTILVADPAKGLTFWNDGRVFSLTAQNAYSAAWLSNRVLVGTEELTVLDYGYFASVACKGKSDGRPITQIIPRDSTSFYTVSGGLWLWHILTTD